MKPNELLDAIGQIDDECINDARSKPKTDKKTWITAASLAACLCVAAACVFGLSNMKKLIKIGLDETFILTDPSTTADTSPKTTNENTNIAIIPPTVSETAENSTEKSTSTEPATEFPPVTHLPYQWADIRERDKSKVINIPMSAREWPWNCKEVFEQFTFVEYNGRTYTIRSRNTLSKDKVGKKLGTASMRGYDIYEDKTHTTTCGIYEIMGIDSSRFIAVKYQGHDGYYVFNMRHYYDPPATLGDLITALNLTETFPLTTIYYGSKEYGLTETDSDALWGMFLKHTDAETLETENIPSGKKKLTFVIVSEELGADNLSWALYDNGYIVTNIDSYGYRYYIGKDAVDEIVKYALGHKAGEIADNTQYIVGNVTEIGENYIKVDDSIMMKNPDDGIEFTVMANDMRIKRYIISGFLKKGQLVRITHTGTLCGNHTVVETATMLEEVMLAKNDIIFFE